MKSLRLGFLGVAALALLTLGTPAYGDITYQLTVDNCTGGCNPGSPGTSMGTVLLHQNGTNDVRVTVTLVSPLEFVNTGLQNSIDFNITGSPTIAASNFTNSNFSLTSGTAGGLHFDGFGNFLYSIQLNTSQGAGGAVPSPVSFDITCASCGLTESSFVQNNATNKAVFGVDVYNTVNGNTGPIGTTGSVPVPEPTSLLLLGTALAFAGKLLTKVKTA